MAFIQKMVCDNCRETISVPPGVDNLEEHVPEGWYKGPLPVPGRANLKWLICNPCIWAIDSALKHRKKGTHLGERESYHERQRAGATDEPVGS